jgi:hypothetical protein
LEYLCDIINNEFISFNLRLLFNYYFIVIILILILSFTFSLLDILFFIDTRSDSPSSSDRRSSSRGGSPTPPSNDPVLTTNREENQNQNQDQNENQNNQVQVLAPPALENIDTRTDSDRNQSDIDVFEVATTSSTPNNSKLSMLVNLTIGGDELTKEDLPIF